MSWREAIAERALPEATRIGGCSLRLLVKLAKDGFIHQSTTTPQGWTAERLQMKSAANVSQQLSRAKKAAKPKIKPAKPVV